MDRESNLRMFLTVSQLTSLGEKGLEFFYIILVYYGIIRSQLSSAVSVRLAKRPKSFLFLSKSCLFLLKSIPDLCKGKKRCPAQVLSRTFPCGCEGDDNKHIWPSSLSIGPVFFSLLCLGTESEVKRQLLRFSRGKRSSSFGRNRPNPYVPFFRRRNLAWEFAHLVFSSRNVSRR